jgi:glycosyltransferase involved in cell wall biosynthesis
VRSLRIAVVKPDWGIRGGFELVLDRVLDHLRSHGHRIDVLPIDAWRPNDRPFGVEVAPEILACAPQLISYLSQVEECRLLDLRLADVVLSTQPPSFTVEHPRHVSLFYHHNRLFYDLAEPAIAAGMVAPEPHLAATQVVREIDQIALSGVSFILAGSETVQERLAVFNGRSHRVDVFHAGPSIEPRDSPQAPNSPQLALCVSRHTFPKRTELFVHAMHLAPDSAGLAVGTGGRLGFVRQLDKRLSEQGAPGVLADSETWLNMPEWIDPETLGSYKTNLVYRTDVADDDLSDCYRSAFCLVAPALAEDYGLTVIEAMQHGLPVITCVDSGHLTRFVEDGVTGFVVEPNGAAIAEAIRELDGDRDRAGKMGAAGRELAESFTWTRAFEDFDRGLRAVLS